MTQRFDYSDDKYDVFRWVRAKPVTKRLSINCDLLPGSIVLQWRANSILTLNIKILINSLYMDRQGWRHAMARDLRYLRREVLDYKRNCVHTFTIPGRQSLVMDDKPYLPLSGGVSATVKTIRLCERCGVEENV